MVSNEGDSEENSHRRRSSSLTSWRLIVERKPIGGDVCLSSWGRSEDDAVSREAKVPPWSPELTGRHPRGSKGPLAAGTAPRSPVSSTWDLGLESSHKDFDAVGETSPKTWTTQGNTLSPEANVWAAHRGGSFLVNSGLWVLSVRGLWRPGATPPSSGPPGAGSSARDPARCLGPVGSPLLPLPPSLPAPPHRQPSPAPPADPAWALMPLTRSFIHSLIQKASN